MRAIVLASLVLLPVIALSACTARSASRAGTTQEEAFPHRNDGSGGGGGGGGGM